MQLRSDTLRVAHRRSDRVKRRQFIALLGGMAAAVPLFARAAAGSQAHWRRLDDQASEDVGAAHAQITALRDELSKRGWVEGRNLQIEHRWTRSRGDLIQKYATELVAMPADVIVSSSSPLLAALEISAATCRCPNPSQMFRCCSTLLTNRVLRGSSASVAMLPRGLAGGT